MVRQRDILNTQTFPRLVSTRHLYLEYILDARLPENNGVKSLRSPIEDVRKGVYRFLEVRDSEDSSKGAGIHGCSGKKG